MTHLADVAGGRDIVTRWCSLAEKRLEYLTELFETGRWRRYYSEQAFLENIQEARAAVDTWRALVTGETPPKRAAGLTNLAGAGPALPRRDEIREPLQWLRPEPAPDAVEPPREIPDDVLIALESQLLASDEAPSVPDAPDLDDMTMPPLDLDVMQQRYPLLRNAL